MRAPPRMRGRRAKWIFGTDHAGIATQRQVENRLEQEGTSRAEIGREAFVSGSGSGGASTAARSPASSARWAPRSTTRTSASRWTTTTCARSRTCSCACTRRGSSTATTSDGQLGPLPAHRDLDLEVEQRTLEDNLYMIDYPLESGSGSLTVATVRPETMLADTAIAVNPGDERYSRLIGEAAILPLVGAGCRSSPTTTWTPSSARARSRSHRPRRHRLRDRPPSRPRGRSP